MCLCIGVVSVHVRVCACGRMYLLRCVVCLKSVVCCCVETVVKTVILNTAKGGAACSQPSGLAEIPQDNPGYMTVALTQLPWLHDHNARCIQLHASPDQHPWSCDQG